MGIGLEITNAPELKKNEEMFSAEKHQPSMCCIQIQQHPSTVVLTLFLLIEVGRRAPLPE